MYINTHITENQHRELTIAQTAIRQDSEGRYCLNDCHRASGMGDAKKPSEWFRNNQTQDLIEELRSAEIPAHPINTIKTGDNDKRGIYAVKELVYAYAMWISPAFHLQVIRAYDDLVQGKYQPAVNLDDPAFLRSTLLTYTEKCMQLEHENNELKPKAEALERIAISEGSTCITNGAKDLQVRPKELFDYLIQNGWIYRKSGGSNWVAYQNKIQQGLLEHKVTDISRSDGTRKLIEQVKITPKGLAKLAELLNCKAA